MQSINLQESITFLTAAVNLLTAVFVLFKRPRNVINRTFFIFGCGTALWVGSMGALLMTHKPIFSTLILYGGIFTVYGLALFATVFPKGALSLRRFILSSLPCLFIAIAIPSGMFINKVAVGARGEPVPVNGPWFYVYVVTVAAYALYAFVVMYRKYVRLDKQARLQIQYLMLGLGSFIGTAFIADALLPALGVFSLNLLGPMASIFFVGLTAYAIVRHHLFNIKIIATELFTLALNILILFRIAASRTVVEAIGGIVVFVGTTVFGIFLVRSVRREIYQREELEELTTRLEAANARLVELGRFKTQLLSLASHQIKSPIAIIKGYLTLLLDGLYGPMSGEIRSTVEKSKKAADELAQLIEDLLNLRRVEEGRMEYSFEKMDIAQVLAELVDNFGPVVRRKGLEFSYDRPKKPIWISGDPLKLKEIFRNLIDNAFKYTDKGFVKVALAEIGKYAEVRVMDSGIGMPKSLMPKLFGEFVRDERVQKEIQGSGFGLYVAKKITEAHGGTITPESEGEGKGSSFIVKLPLQP